MTKKIINHHNTPKATWLLKLGRKYYMRMWSVPYFFQRENYLQNIKKTINELGR